MRKLFLVLIYTGFINFSYANYLENWPNDALCSWMENPLPPSYMVEEVRSRDIKCSGGIVIIPPIEEIPPISEIPPPIEEIPPISEIPPPIERPPITIIPDPSPTPEGSRPGWKIAEGSNFWTIDEDDPYWQTEEGNNKLQASKKRGSLIEKEASAYEKENPGVDPPIASYYATDGCGEGKQPANSSC
jgi:hypothetical protein